MPSFFTQAYSTTPPLGIKLSMIHDFIVKNGGRSKFASLTSGQVIEKVIKPLTKRVNLSYCEALTNSCKTKKCFDSSNFEAAMIVSHAWEDLFLDFVDALDDYFSDMMVHDDDIVLWVDMFCLNHHDCSEEKWANSVQTASKNVGNTVLVMSPWDALSVFRSPMCLYQIHYAGYHGYLFEVAMNKSDQFRVNQIAAANRATVENLLTNHISTRSDLGAYDHLIPPIALDLLLQDVKQTSADLQNFVSQIQKIMKDWLNVFLANKLQDTGGVYFHADQEEVEVLNSSPISISRTTSGSAEENDDLDGDGVMSSFVPSSPNPFMRNSPASLDRAHIMASLQDSRNSGSNSGMSSTANSGESFQAMLLGPDNGHTATNYDEHSLARVLKIQRETLGWTHRDTLSTSLKLAKLFVKVEKFVMAEVMFSSYLEGMITSKGPEHSETITAKKTVADFYFSRQQYSKAAILYESVYKYVEENQGKTHFSTLFAASVLANVYSYMQNFTMAEALSKLCYDRIREIHEDNHPSVLLYKTNYERILDASAQSRLETGVLCGAVKCTNKPTNQRVAEASIMLPNLPLAVPEQALSPSPKNKATTSTVSSSTLAAVHGSSSHLSSLPLISQATVPQAHPVSPSNSNRQGFFRNRNYRVSEIN